MVFHTRLALSVVDSASRRTHQRVQNEAAQLATRIQHIGDGYAARDVLAHADSAALLTEDQIAGLAGAMNARALGQGGISAELQLKSSRR